MENTCIIIDDEPVARRILRNWCEQSKLLEVVTECEDGLEALAALQKYKVAVIFLDVNMPRLDGLSLLKNLQDRPAVILTTAYSEHALEAFDLDVADYLAKPISFERFLRAVQRALKTPAGNEAVGKENNEFEGVVIRFGRQIHRIPFHDILFCEARLNVCRIVTKTSEFKTYQPLNQIQAQLPPRQFMRVHRSFLVNLQHVFKLDGPLIHLGEHRVPVSESYWEEVLAAIGG
jgi:DNA-binding LytR/AlgR family response regulator